MLEQGLGYGGNSLKIPEQCKRDYEAEIKRERVGLGKVVTLKDAILGYAEGRPVQGKLAELLGELVSLEIMHNKQIDQLIQAQEKENAE